MAFRVTGKDGDVVVTTDHEHDAIECAKQYAASMGEAAKVAELKVDGGGDLVPDPERVKTYRPRRGATSMFADSADDDAETKEESPEPSRKPSSSTKSEPDK